DVTSRISQVTRDYCGGLRLSAPLVVEFHHRGVVLAWRFGPYRDGSWRLVMGYGTQAYEVSSRDAFRLPGVSALKLRVRYESPQRWVTYSPEISLDFVNHPDFLWRR